MRISRKERKAAIGSAIGLLILFDVSVLIWILSFLDYFFSSAEIMLQCGETAAVFRSLFSGLIPKSMCNPDDLYLFIIFGCVLFCIILDIAIVGVAKKYVFAHMLSSNLGQVQTRQRVK